MKALEIHTVDYRSMHNILFDLHGGMQYPVLQSLSLSTPPYPQSRRTSASSQPNLKPRAVPGWCKIKHMSIENIPFDLLPFYFFPNLTTLEITYPDSPVPPFAPYVVELCEVLRVTTQLEELSLVATNPYPVSYQSPGQATAQASNAQVLLTHLDTLRWIFHVRFFNDAAQLMSRLDAPALHALDISLLPPYSLQASPSSVLAPMKYIDALARNSSIGTGVETASMLLIVRPPLLPERDSRASAH